MAKRTPPKTKQARKGAGAKRATSRTHAREGVRAKPKAPSLPPVPALSDEARKEKARLDKENRRLSRRDRQRAEVMALLSEEATMGPAPVTPGPEATVAQRVDHCWLLMSNGRWLNYRTRLELATAWNVADSTIRDYAAEASRRLRLEPEEIDAAKLQHARFCETVQEQALTTFNDLTGMPDFGAALKANELAARFKGIEIDGPKKLELTGKDGGPIETKAPVIMVPAEIEE